MPPEEYGLWTLLPALSAITLAVITRRVLPSLAVGVAVASFMLLPCLAPEEEHGASNVITGTVRVAALRFVWDAAILDRHELTGAIQFGHVEILAFTSIIAAMVGMIGASGGTRALVEVIARRASGRRGGQVMAWAAGLVVFFDDYANSMIVGPTMQPIFDRLKLSRAKLAYIVDSTAAPVASIALIGTWLGAEIAFLQAGFKALEQSGEVPAFLHDVRGWEAFYYSLPHRYYAIFAIVMVGLIAASGRDFGPMLTAERGARAEADSVPIGAAETVRDAPRPRWWLAGLPICALITVTLGVLFYTGWYGVERGEARTFDNVLAEADPYASILYGAISSAGLALMLSILTGALGLGAAIRAACGGVRRVAPALVILVLAWALSAASQDLHLGEIASRTLSQARFSATWLPLGIFLCAAGVSFATGTSWGTMGILCPVVVTVAARLTADLPEDFSIGRRLDLFYASVGSVLAGAVFGDHCSPISDTTVLSSIASGCSLERHVWTQLPYALAAALAGMVFGDLLIAYAGAHWSLGLILGCGALGLLVRWLGRPSNYTPT